MLTIILILLTIAVAGGITWWLEEGPEHFYEPEPFAPVNPPRYPRHTYAGYKPPRRTRVRKEIQYR